MPARARQMDPTRARDERLTLLRRGAPKGGVDVCSARVVAWAKEANICAANTVDSPSSLPCQASRIVPPHRVMKDYVHFPSATPRLEVRVARGRPELTAAFELVYRSYLAKGYVEPHPGGVVYQASFSLRDCRTIVAVTQRGDIAGTLTVVGDSHLALQVEATYPAEVESLRKQDRRLAEITCLATEPSGEFQPRAVFFALTKFMIHYAYAQRYDDLLMAIHPRHYRFYWHCFRVYPLGPCRPHGPARGNPAVGCRIDMDSLKRNLHPRVREQYFSDVHPEAHYLGTPVAPADHLYFYSRREIAPDTGCDGRGQPWRRAG